MDKLVSIVVPVYNMGDSIETCMSSILNQKYKNIEIIMVDDGSTDNSYQKCCDIAQRDNRVKAYHTENSGAGPARNYGIAHANGEFIYFPDADDYLDPNTISICVDAMEDGKFDLVVFGFKTLTRDGKFLFDKQYTNCEKTGDELRQSYSTSFGYTSEYAIQGAPWNKFFRRDVIKAYGIEFPPLRRHQDEAFISRYMCHAQNVRFIEPVLYIYYENDLKNQWQKFPANYIDIVNELYAIRLETVVSWNPDDYATHELVEVEYVSKVIKALELSYSPKLTMNRTARSAYFREVVHKSNLNQRKIPEGLGGYQKYVCKYLLRNQLGKAASIIRIKIWTEKTGLLNKIRGFRNK